VDTPEAHAEAERLISALGEELEAPSHDAPEHSRVTGVWPRASQDRAAAIKKARER